MRFTLITIAALMTSVAAADEKPEANEEKEVKTVKAEIKKGSKVLLTLSVPEAWKQEAPKSNLRLAQFVIPKVEGDEEDAEMAVFNFGAGGGVKANIDRWIGQFQAEGRESKVTQGELEKGRYFFVELSGTYNKPVGPPIRRQTKPTPGSRMLGVILGIEDQGVFFFKMTGPDKTVAKERKSLRISFGADIEKEKEVNLDDPS